MRFTCALLLLAFFASCASSDKKAVSKNPHHTLANLLKQNEIDSLVAANHIKIAGEPGDFPAFKKYLEGLNDADPASIPYALDYIKTYLPADLPQKDSALLLFNIKFYKVTNKLTEALENTYSGLMKKMQTDSNAVAVLTFKHNLKQCGIGMYMTEGNNYLDILPDYLQANFKDRVSDGVREYLKIRRLELEQGFSEDAGLLISFDQLYQRVKRWEKFLADYPNTVYTNEATGYYTTYFETLLTGMDNSRIFTDESVLSPEVKTIYEAAIKHADGTATTKIISGYYDLLSRHEFKENDSLAVFLKANKLSTMIAVQPETR